MSNSQSTDDSARVESQKMIAQTAMADPEQLKRWLRESRRQFVVFAAQDLVDALPWPDGVRQFMGIVGRYRTRRMTARPPRVERSANALGQAVEVQVAATDELEPEELDRLVHWAAAALKEHDPGWSFEKGLTARTGG